MYPAAILRLRTLIRALYPVISFFLEGPAPSRRETETLDLEDEDLVFPVGMSG